MKSLLFMICLLVIVPSLSHAENWVHIYGEPARDFYIDADSISSVDSNPGIHKMTVKVVYPNASNIKLAVAELEINCWTKRWRETKVTLYDLKGNSMPRSVNPEWQNIEDEGGAAGALLTFINCLETK